MNRQADRQTERQQTDRQTDRETGRQTDRTGQHRTGQTDRTDRQDRQTDRHRGFIKNALLCSFLLLWLFLDLMF